MKLKKGDNVLIISGKDKGKTAKILKVIVKNNQVLVEGVNIRKKHIKPKKEGEKGQIISLSVPLNASNVKFICPKCNKAVRIGYKVISVKSKVNNNKTAQKENQKFRICKKCQSEV